MDWAFSTIKSYPFLSLAISSGSTASLAFLLSHKKVYRLPAKINSYFKKPHFCLGKKRHYLGTIVSSVLLFLGVSLMVALLALLALTLFAEVPGLLKYLPS